MNIIINNIMQNPPILIGLVALIGLLLQKKGISELVKGTLTASFGMVALTEGVNMLTGVISPINTAFQKSLGVTSSNSLNDVTFTAKFGGEVGLAMFLGLIIHLIIARFTPIKTIFLTGHMLWWFPFVIVAGGVEGGLNGWKLIVFSAILSALYWSIMPWLMRKFVWAATKDESFLIGHPTGILSLLSGFVAKHLGNKEHSTENINIPKKLSFFREISVTGSIVIFLMYVIVSFIIPSLPGKKNLLFNSINQGLTFAAGLLILLYGVRLLINQIIPAFQGISEKLIPNAKPAFDVPVLFNYKPNAVLVGFITAMITSTILVIFSDSFHIFHIMLVPLVITSFFECGGAAIVGEGQGGLRGSILGTASAAILMVILVGFSGTMFGSTIQNWILIFGGNDLSLMGIISKILASWL
ncbi:PTS ascorbate transporter subunit IIC [Liquorilactobacillus ghanensis]|nr:PTS ascorbate transporter subunit IIC [Liquorilactobacillus ghanensis]